MIKNFFIALLLFLIVWYLAKAIVRLFNLFVSKSDSNSGSTNNSGKKNNITFDISENKKKRFDKNEGDYVDFEEVK